MLVRNVTFDRTGTGDSGKALFYSAWETSVSYSSLQERKVKLGISLLRNGFTADHRLIPDQHDVSGQKIHFKI